MYQKNLFVQHHNRAIIKITGADKISFLQGLITNDLKKLEKNKLLFACFLTGNGRFLYDFFVFEIGDILYIDIIKSDCDDFAKKLKMYKLRSDVQFEILDDCMVCQLFTENNNLDKGSVVFKDPRSSKLGYRLYILHNHSFNFEGFNKADINYYHQQRIANRIVESNELIKEKSIILEFGYKEQNAIAFDKGCYLGQELITRTERLGEIRKKLFNFELEQELSDQMLQNLSDNKVKIISKTKFNDKFCYLVLAKITKDHLIQIIENQ
jgi:folate-binding protein YgfZ